MCKTCFPDFIPEKHILGNKEKIPNDKKFHFEFPIQWGKNNSTEKLEIRCYTKINKYLLSNII